MLLDPYGLLCLLSRHEPHHVQSHSLYKAAVVRVTHNYVLAEFVALAATRGVARIDNLRFVQKLTANPDIETVWVDETLHQAAFNLLRSRLDKTYSLCDAVSFVLMRQRGIMEALTNDKHFEQEGFVRLLK